MQPDSIRFRLEKKRRKKKGSLARIPLGATCLDSWLYAGNWNTPREGFFFFFFFFPLLKKGQTFHSDFSELPPRGPSYLQDDFEKALPKVASAQQNLARAKFWRLSGCFFVSLSEMVSFHLFRVTLVILLFPSSLGFKIILLSLSPREKEIVFLKGMSIFL